MPTFSSEYAGAHQGLRTRFSRAGALAPGSVALAFGGLDVLGGVGGAWALAALLVLPATDQSIRPPGSRRDL